MEVKKARTVRLDQLIKTSGRPEAVTLWTKPEENPGFMRAVKEQRVMTVIQRNVGTKRDYGLVGFFPKELAAFWVFPKPIVAADETKVIGINYERLAPSEPRGPLHKPKTRNRKPGNPLKREHIRPRPSSRRDRAPTPPKTPPAPRELTFRSAVQITATQSIDLEVKAPSPSAAAELLKVQAGELSIDPHRATISRKITKPKKVP